MPDAEESNPPPEEASPEETPNEGENNMSAAINSSATSIPATTTVKTTTMKTFVPTVAGERGIYAPWPKKVTICYYINLYS